jgi:hypothetical protein
MAEDVSATAAVGVKNFSDDLELILKLKCDVSVVSSYNQGSI